MLAAGHNRGLIGCHSCHNIATTRIAIRHGKLSRQAEQVVQVVMCVYSCIPNNGTGWNNSTGWKHAENLIKVQVRIIIQVGKVHKIESKCMVFTRVQNQQWQQIISKCLVPKGFCSHIPLNFDYVLPSMCILVHFTCSGTMKFINTGFQ